MIRLSAIGDVCHLLPAVRSIQAAWPRASLTWIVGAPEAALVGDIPGIEFLVFDKKEGLAGLAGLRARLRDRRFDVLVHAHPSWRANLVSRLVRADRRLGFDRPRARDLQWMFTDERMAARRGEHAIDAFFGFPEALGIARGGLRWDIPLADADRDFARAHMAGEGPAIVISPCANPRSRVPKDWTVEGYAAVAAHGARAHGARVVVTGAGSARETSYARAIAAAAPGRVTDLVGRTTLKRLLAVLEAADVVVCPDSGPAHMATAVGTPVVGLYATTNPGHSGPYLSRDLAVDRYPEAVRRTLGRAVDQVRWGRRIRSAEAMRLIEVADVTDALDRALAPPRGYVLLDRDGVINVDLPDSVLRPEEFETLPGAAAGIAELNRKGYRVLVVTNQACVGRGDLDQAGLEAIHGEMRRQVAAAGGRIDAIYVCPHRDEDGCDCRKPRPGLLRRAQKEWRFEPAAAWLVGDAARDLEAARAAGLRPALVLTGKGSRVEAPRDVAVFDDLAHFARDMAALRDER